MQSDSKRKRKGEVQSVKQKWPTGQGPGPGWNSKKAVTGFAWDPKEGRILWPDGTPTLSQKALEDAAEALEDEKVVQVVLDVFAGTQSMGPVCTVYHQRKGVAYILLDIKEVAFSSFLRARRQNS